MSNITPFGLNLERDDSGMFSLTDLWKFAGSDVNKSPAEWQRISTTEAFIKAVSKVLNMGIAHVIKSKRGKGGGTYAHEQIALEYAQYLDPNLAICVNELFLNPEAATNHAIKVWEKKGKSKSWIGERMSGVLNRKQFTDTLMIHGVRGSGFKDCTNAIYTPLWGGGAELVRLKKGLKEKANTRESMTEIELASVRLAELLAKETIEKCDAKGNAVCEKICQNSGKAIATSIIAMRNNNQKNLPSL